MNSQKVVGKVGKFNSCFRQERLTSHAGTVLLHDFAQRLGVEGLLDEELSVKRRARGYSEGQAMGGLIYNRLCPKLPVTREGVDGNHFCGR